VSLCRQDDISNHDVDQDMSVVTEVGQQEPMVEEKQSETAESEVFGHVSRFRPVGLEDPVEDRPAAVTKKRSRWFTDHNGQSSSSTVC